MNYRKKSKRKYTPPGNKTYSNICKRDMGVGVGRYEKP